MNAIQTRAEQTKSVATRLNTDELAAFSDAAQEFGISLSMLMYNILKHATSNFTEFSMGKVVQVKKHDRDSMVGIRMPADTKALIDDEAALRELSVSLMLFTILQKVTKDFTDSSILDEERER